MFCLYCGTEIPDDAVYCYRCGKRQREQTPAKNVPKVQGTVHMNEDSTVEMAPLAVGSIPTGQSIPDSEGKTRNIPLGAPKHTRGWTRSIVLTILLLVLLLAAGGIGAYQYIGQQNASAPGGMALARTTAQEFCSFLVQKDYQSAYNMMGYSDLKSVSEFQTFMEGQLNSNAHLQHSSQGPYTATGCNTTFSSQYNSQDYEINVFGVFDFSDGAETGFDINVTWNSNTHRYEVLGFNGVFNVN